MSGRIWRPNDPIWLPTENKAASEERLSKTLVETGLFETGHGFLFVCPICGRKERNDQRMEPLCDGPSWMKEHEPEIMQLQRQ